jgi:hypothetical protein
MVNMVDIIQFMFNIYIYMYICIYVIFQYQKMVPMYMTCHILYHIVSLLYLCVKSACPGLLKPWPHVAAARHWGCQQSLRTAMHLPWVFWEQRVQWCQHWVEDGQTGPIKLKTSKQLKNKNKQNYLCMSAEFKPVASSEDWTPRDSMGHF